MYKAVARGVLEVWHSPEKHLVGKTNDFVGDSYIVHLIKFDLSTHMSS
jgi:hypothetical protein